jgi:hypothetical protein
VWNQQRDQARDAAQDAADNPGCDMFEVAGCGQKQLLCCDHPTAVDADGTTVIYAGNVECQQQSFVASPIAFPAAARWASSVVAFSSQFSTPSWSASQALGAPNTYPTCGDLPSAWATKAQNSPGEYLTLAFAPPAAGASLWVVETFNPDAVAKVTITTPQGEAVIYDHPEVAATGDCAHVLQIPTGTSQPISQVRIDLAADKVPGWNEIDAVGIVP